MRSTLLAALVLLAACAHAPAQPEAASGTAQALSPAHAPTLELVASSPRQWTGVTVSKQGRIFVSFPRWSNDVPISVGELKNGTVTPWPDAAWNDWKPGTKDKGPAEERFVAVQSVVIDDQDRLWVVDTGNPGFKGVVATPQLHVFDVSTGQRVRSYPFPPELYEGKAHREKPTQDAYLNDVRVDDRNQVAYLTDSQAGGLVVLDLKTGIARKVLEDHPSTHAETDRLTVMGRPFEREMHSDGIALSPDGQTLYWTVLSGHTLWRIATAALRDASMDDRSLANRVERVEAIEATDGLLFDRQGTLWLGGLEKGAIYRYSPETKKYEQVLQDPRLRWPDTFAQGPDGKIYVTLSQIHLPPAERGPYELYRFTP